MHVCMYIFMYVKVNKIVNVPAAYKLKSCIKKLELEKIF